MANRHLFRAPQVPEMDYVQIRNHPHPNPHFLLENGSFVLPTDVAANIALRPNDYPSSSFPNYMATNPGSLHNPYLHPSSTVSSSRFPPDQSQHVPTFNQHRSGGMVNPQTDIGRAASKRKSPAMSLAFDRGNTSGYYCPGSSSNLNISSDHVRPKPMPMPQYCPLDPTSIVPSYRSDYPLTAGEGSQRNVRSRHSHAVHIEINPAATYSSSNPPRQLYLTGNISGPNMVGQWSHAPMPIAPQGRILSSAASLYEMNQSLAGSNVINSTIGIIGAYPQNLTQNGNPSAALPTHRGPSTRGLGAGSSSYNQRPNPYRASSSYPPVGSAAAALEDGGPPGAESVASSRYSRPLSIIGRSSYTNGRARNSYGRFQAIYDEDNARGRWLSEDAVTMDRSTFYDSRNLFDQHRDMRLDIDNMSYEELLALEERIGNVSTGLSEETISGCLVESMYCSSNQIGDDQKGNCVICLEEYEDQDNLGRLNCGHDFHVSCIKNWLLIKNACPICKAAAFSDS